VIAQFQLGTLMCLLCRLDAWLDGLGRRSLSPPSLPGVAEYAPVPSAPDAASHSARGVKGLRGVRPHKQTSHSRAVRPLQRWYTSLRGSTAALGDRCVCSRRMRQGHAYAKPSYVPYPSGGEATHSVRCYAPRSVHVAGGHAIEMQDLRAASPKSGERAPLKSALKSECLPSPPQQLCVVSSVCSLLSERKRI